MNVKELIAILQQLENQEWEIWYSNEDIGEMLINKVTKVEKEEGYTIE